MSFIHETQSSFEVVSFRLKSFRIAWKKVPLTDSWYLTNWPQGTNLLRWNAGVCVPHAPLVLGGLHYHAVSILIISVSVLGTPPGEPRRARLWPHHVALFIYVIEAYPPRVHHDIKVRNVLLNLPHYICDVKLLRKTEKTKLEF